MSTMNIVFGSDNGYVEHLTVALCSLFENNSGMSFNIYVINADIDEANWKVLEDFARKYHQKIIDIKIFDEDLEGVVINQHFTKATYYRLFIPEKISADKVLYLDSDIVVTGKIEALYNTDLGDSYLAAVINPNFDRHEELDMSPESKYFNAGVMLINVPLWLRQDLKGKVLDVVRKKPEAILFVDQCGLNSVVNGQWNELHPRFNVQGYFFEQTQEFAKLFPDGQLLAAIEDPTIVHYTGSTKPWSLFSDHPLKRLYWKYQSMTPFRRRFPKDITLLNILKRATPKSIKRMIKR